MLTLLMKIRELRRAAGLRRRRRDLTVMDEVQTNQRWDSKRNFSESGCLQGSYHIPSILSPLHTSTQLIPTTALWYKHYPHFTNKETEAKKIKNESSMFGTWFELEAIMNRFAEKYQNKSCLWNNSDSSSCCYWWTRQVPYIFLLNPTWRVLVWDRN